MYNEGYAYGGDGSASSCMSVVDFIIHYAYLPSEKSFNPSLWLILRRELAEGFIFNPFRLVQPFPNRHDFYFAIFILYLC